MDLSGTAALKVCTSIDPVTFVTGEAAAHALGGSVHTADTLANLNTKVSDATLVDATAISGEIDGDVGTHAALTNTHGASDIADVSDIAVDANLSSAAQAAVAASHAQNTDTDLDATFEATFEKGANKGANNGYCGLGAGGLVDATDLPAATDSAQGASELATAAETTTGTDATRAVTPDGLAGSDYGKRSMIIPLVADDTALATGDGKIEFELPDWLAGWNLVAVKAYVSTVSSSGLPTYMIHNLTAAADILSTALTIDANEKSSRTAATPAVINASEDDVTLGDVYRIDKDVQGTGEKGDKITLTFQKP